jgi:hypothetical protein
LISGVTLFVLLSLPIGLFIYVNSFRLNSIHLWFVTIPRLPSQPRYEAISSIFNLRTFFHSLYDDTKILAKLLLFQTDGESRDIVVPYGYLYTITFPFALIGAGSILFSLFKKSQQFYQIILLLLWSGISVVLGVLQPSNFNRVNIIFIPIIFCLAYFLLWIKKRFNPGFILLIIAFVIAFISFKIAYHGEPARAQIDPKYFVGMIPATEFISHVDTSSPVCVSDQISMAYIFVLFSERMNPKSYLSTIDYVDSAADFRIVRHLNRYSFGIDNCVNSLKTNYLFQASEKSPTGAGQFKKVAFGDYIVYIPQP